MVINCVKTFFARRIRIHRSSPRRRTSSSPGKPSEAPASIVQPRATSHREPCARGSPLAADGSLNVPPCNGVLSRHSGALPSRPGAAEVYGLRSTKFWYSPNEQASSPANPRRQARLSQQNPSLRLAIKKDGLASIAIRAIQHKSSSSNATALVEKWSKIHAISGFCRQVSKTWLSATARLLPRLA